MINGAHVIVYSTDPEADRGFLLEVLGLPHVDVGGGWLIFGLPPSEVAVHPAEKSGAHELYLMCEDIDAFVVAMGKRSIACSAVQNQGWGLLTQITLPGGGKLGVYQPRHARPAAMDVAPRGRAATKTKTTPSKRTKPAPKRAKPGPKRGKAAPKRGR